MSSRPGEHQQQPQQISISINYARLFVEIGRDILAKRLHVVHVGGIPMRQQTALHLCHLNNMEIYCFDCNLLCVRLIIQNQIIDLIECNSFEIPAFFYLPLSLALNTLQPDCGTYSL